MKRIRICAVVTGKTIGGFLKNLEEIQKVADFVELRVDYINGFSVSDIDLIKSKTRVRAIFTCRKKEEGGFFTGTESEREEVLKKAMEAGFDYVDVELAAAVNFQFSIFNFQSNQNDSNKKSKIILSYHNFNNTPAIFELEMIKQEMKKYSSDIMKFATFVRDDADSKILFQFLLDKKDDEKVICVGMGEKGKMTRIVAPLLGSYLTYASTSYSSSALGQIDINKLKKLYNEFGEV